MTAKPKEPHILLVAENHHPIERQSHLWCNRCDERLVLGQLSITTMLEISKGFERAHKACAKKPKATPTERPSIKKPSDWLKHGEVGTSSHTIYSVMTGGVPLRPSTPADPDDFRRCHILLEAFPEWRTRMLEMVKVYPEWGPLVREWDALTVLFLEELPSGSAPRLYARMRELESEA